MSKRRLSTVLSSRNWLGGGFVSVVLILLVAVPVVINIQGRAMHQGIKDFGAPATTAASDIQKSLSHEVSGVIGLQESGEPRYAELYKQQRTFVLEKLSDLDRLAPNLGPSAELRVKELRGAIEKWHGYVEAYKLATVQLEPAESGRRFFASDALRQSAHEAAAKFHQEAEIWRAGRWEALAETQRLGVILAAILGLLALISIFLVRQLVMRLQDAAVNLQRRIKEEESLREVADSLAAAHSLNDVLRRITQTAALAGEAAGVFIKSINVTKNEITAAAAYGEGVPNVGTKGPYIGSFADRAVRTGTPIIIASVGSEVVKHKSLIDAQTCQDCTGLVVPLISDGDPLGALVLLRHRPRLFTAAEFPRLQILGDMAAVVMRRALTTEKLVNLQAQEHFLSEAARILASTLDYKTTLKTVVRLAVPRIADWCIVHLVEDGKIETVEVAHVDPEKTPFVQQLQGRFPPQLDESSGAFRVIRTGRSELYSEIDEDLLKTAAQNAEHLEILRQLHLKSSMVVPLLIANEAFGALTFVSEQSGRYGPDDLAFAEDVARHAAFAIQNARLYTGAQNALRTRDEVLRVVSHDLRNPINNISMTASMLLNAPGEDRRASKGMLQIIKRASERMNHLIEDLIGVARVEAGQEIPLDIQPENPISIIQEACESSKIEAQNKSIRLACEAPSAMPLVRADRNRILQVLYN